MDTRKYYYAIYYFVIGCITIGIIWTQNLSGAAFGALFIVLFLLCLVPIYSNLQNTGAKKEIGE